MGQALYQAHPEARAILAQADQALGQGLTRLCFEGPEEVLTDTINAQPAILTVSVAALEAMKAQGVCPSPTFVAGHSMGEFSALVAAGSLSFIAALHLVRERGRLMKLAGERSPGRMAAVLGLEAEKVAAICEQVRQEHGGVLQIANDNCPGQTVISGDETLVDPALEAAEAAGARKVVKLAISIASHCPLMSTISDEFAAVIDAAPIAHASIPLVANVSAMPITHADDIRAELKAQLTSSVRWAESMHYLVAQGTTRVVEIGPKDVLTKLMKRIERKVERVNVGDAAISNT
jgi:[acyl-carrier-protein] S-malonyltransferase